MACITRMLDRGCPVAQRMMAMVYLAWGENDKSIAMLKESAEAGFLPAQVDLAERLEKAPGGKSKALKWFTRAALLGRHPESLFNLLSFYDLKEEGGTVVMYGKTFHVLKMSA
jgi:TPR repeat protein